MFNYIYIYIYIHTHTHKYMYMGFTESSVGKESTFNVA